MATHTENAATVQKIKAAIEAANGKLKLSDAEFGEAWKKAGLDKQKISRQQFEVISRMITKFSDEDCLNFLETGNLPATKLNSAEMESLQGGTSPGCAIGGMLLLMAALWCRF